MTRGTARFAAVVGAVWVVAGLAVGLATREWRWAVLVVFGASLLVLAAVRRPRATR